MAGFDLFSRSPTGGSEGAWVVVVSDPMMLLSLIFSMSVFAESGCTSGLRDLDGVFRLETECREGRVHQKKYYFVKNGTMGRFEEYREGRLWRTRIWSIEGTPGATFENRYESDSIWIEDVFDEKTGQLIRRSRRTGSPGYDQPYVTLQDWFIRDGKPREIDHYIPGTSTVTLRQMLNDAGSVQFQMAFTYSVKRGKYDTPHLTKVDFQDPTGRTQNVFIKGFDTQENVILQAPVSEAQKQVWFLEYMRPKEPVLIIDSGFDVRHYDLISKIWRNPFEPLDGKDNDGNGWIDDVGGWNIKSGNNDISDSLFLPSRGEPLSHGTHVASIALKGVRAFGLLGYAGNMTSPELLSRAIGSVEKYGIRFANMSFGWEGESPGMSPFTPGSASTHALEDLIAKSPKTLFVAAASNEGSELRYDSFCPYPACFKYRNLMTVGALNISEARAELLPKARLADFSNFSEEYVDIFAPGEQVLGAGLGQRHIRLDGTSMAAPFALNTLLRMAERASGLSPMVLKEIVLKSAYIPTQPLRARSGGMLFPERAFRALQYFVGGVISVEGAVRQARLATPMTGELRDEETLRQIWAHIR